MSPATCAFFLAFFGMRCVVTAALRSAALQPYIKATKPANTLIFFLKRGKCTPGTDKKVIGFF